VSQPSTTPLPVVPTSISYYYDSADPQQTVNNTTDTPAASKTLPESEDEPPTPPSTRLINEGQLPT